MHSFAEQGLRRYLRLIGCCVCLVQASCTGLKTNDTDRGDAAASSDGSADRSVGNGPDADGGPGPWPTPDTGAGGAAAVGGSGAPGADGADGGLSEPTRDGAAGPEGGTTQPEAGTEQPEGGTTQPEAGTEQPEGGTAEPDACTEHLFYLDADGDTYGNAQVTVAACEAPADYVLDNSDCDDDCEQCHPGGSEVCDGEKDENCDEAIDEGCACTSGATRPCGSSEGACEEGTQSCTDGQWGDCEGDTGPTDEVCDGVDQDCNGTADDPFTDLGDSCAVGTGKCRSAGTYVCNPSGSDTTCNATAGQPDADEICGNGVDDDCDGDTDEAPASGCCTDTHCGSDERCEGGTCVPKTWCELQSRPADVSASDYQCLDFDASTALPGSPWSAEVAGQGELGISSTRYLSASHSLRSHVEAETETGSNADSGRLSWEAYHPSEAVSSVSVSASLFPAPFPGPVVETGWVDLLCIENPDRRFCLGHIRPTVDYTGLFVMEEILTGGAAWRACPVEEAELRALPANTWTRVELRASSSTSVSLLVEGTAATLAECAWSLSNSTAATVFVGNRATATTGSAMTVHYDNVIVAVRR